MIAYDVEAWSDLGVATLGAAAALIGLLFIAVSINLERILALPLIPLRAVTTLVMLTCVLLISIAMLIPGQGIAALGVEFIVICAFALCFTLPYVRNRHRSTAARIIRAVVILLVPAILVLIGAITLLLQAGGGLYWVAGAIVTGFLGAIANSWVLLVEIMR